MRAGAALLCSFVCACSTQIEVRANHDPDFDFSPLKSYRWAPPSKSHRTDQAFDATVRERVDRELADKGFTKTTAGADFVVDYKAMLTRRRTSEQMGDDYEYTDIWRTEDHTPRVWHEETYEREYTEGALVLLIGDPKSKHLVWRAEAETEVMFREANERARARLHRAIGRMLARFPPKPGQPGS